MWRMQCIGSIAAWLVQPCVRVEVGTGLSQPEPLGSKSGGVSQVACPWSMTPSIMFRLAAKLCHAGSTCLHNLSLRSLVQLVEQQHIRQALLSGLKHVRMYCEPEVGTAGATLLLIAAAASTAWQATHQASEADGAPPFRLLDSCQD